MTRSGPIGPLANSQVVDFPNTEGFVGITAAGFLTLLIQQCDGTRQAEWRLLQIKQPPVTIGRILILRVIRKRRHDDPS